MTSNSESKIVLIENFQQCVEAVKILRRHCAEVPVLGFDCEWVNAPDVSLLQLCSHKGYCAVIRLCNIPNPPSSLCDLLSDRKVVKVGVGTTIDCKYLKSCNLPTYSTLDLRFVAKLTGERAQNLADMYKDVVGGTLNKDFQLSCSDWEAFQLTPQQIQYAADDAIAGMDIYLKLAKKVADVKVFEDYYNMNYIPYRHGNLESVATNECSLQ
ncbi:exonuclease 3'-5' domain-containing protein 2-like isoform X2 [Zeugodacus cucurbitae]|nr:exonuclease 3'-5' domain-containing protein 2-like isoform X2 [Zeugodacus cucurbitae]